MKLVKKLFVGGVLMLGAASASAGLIMTIDDSATSGIDVTVNDDGGAFDGTANDGKVGYNNSFFGGFANWNLASSFTSNKYDANPLVHFDANVESTSGHIGSLTITMIDDQFTLGAGPSIFESVLTGLGPLDMVYEVNVTNIDTDVDLISFSWSGPGSIDEYASAFADLSSEATYQLKVTTIFTSNGTVEQTSIDSTVSAVPEPASLALMGLGLLGMGAARRRRA